MSVRYKAESETWLRGQCCDEKLPGAHFVINVMATGDDGGSVETDAIVHLACALMIALTQGASITPEQFKKWYDVYHGATS